MTDWQDTAMALGWADGGTAVLLDELAHLSDDDLDAPSLLPGWDRRHVLAHVARNAEGLSRLMTWARTGAETPMYASQGARDADIETSCRQTPAELRADVRATADSFRRDIDSIPSSGWTVEVRGRSGAPFAATKIPWMRAREVWLHAIDLDSSASPAWLPADFAEALIDDVVASFRRRADVPAFEIAGADTAGRWRIATADSQKPDVQVTGPVRELACWLVGRSSGATLGSAAGGLPELPAWL